MSAVHHLHPPVVWLLTDNKPGHRNQLLGLGLRLQTLAGAKLVWVDKKKHPVPLWRALLGVPAPMPYPDPNIAIAAGTGTHRLLLTLRRKSKLLTAVVMRPSFPANWVDAAIIPAHDLPPRRPGILATQGAINGVTPLSTRLPQSAQQNQGLILLGGRSRHFAWDDDIIYEQIAALSEQYPEWTWHLGSSRRTPEALIERILKSNLPNIEFYHHDETEPDWLHQAMAWARVVWVSPDSVSMVYESLTAGLPTGLFKLEPARNSRVAQGIVELERRGQVAPWADRMALMKADPRQLEPLWEADRAARWLLKQWELKL